MKIDTNLSGAGGLASPDVKTNEAAQAQRAAAAAAGAAGNTTRADAPDQVRLSGLLEHLRTGTENTPERDALIARLASQVEDGSYDLDAPKISGALIDDTLKG
jgi:anti-sigma28 factor (negative regulator of flagellin synthesis)